MLERRGRLVFGERDLRQPGVMGKEGVERRLTQRILQREKLYEVEFLVSL